MHEPLIITTGWQPDGLIIDRCSALVGQHLPALMGLKNANAITGAFTAGWVVTMGSY